MMSKTIDISYCQQLATMNSSDGCQLKTSAWDIGLRHQLKTSAWDIGSRHQLKTSAWDIGLRHQLKTSAWDISLRHQLVTSALEKNSLGHHLKTSA